MVSIGPAYYDNVDSSSSCLSRERKNDMVRSAFIQTGISIRPDGSQDYLIRIKDVAKSQICWTGWEQAEDGTIITGNEYGELPITALDEIDEFVTEE